LPEALRPVGQAVTHRRQHGNRAPQISLSLRAIANLDQSQKSEGACGSSRY
jgi:hypothetical protein